MKTIPRQVIGFGLLALFATLGRYLLVSLRMQPFPNFEVVTVAAFIGIMILDVRVALFIPLVGMVCSDILIGNPVFTGEKMNQIVLFTYSGFALVALASTFVGSKVKPYVSSIKLQSVSCMIVTGALLVFFYDMWTNFGWWYLMYPHTVDTLLIVYALGVPFMLYHLFSGIATFLCIGLPVISYVYSKKGPVTNNSSCETWRQGVPAGVIALLLILVSVTGCVSTSVRESNTIEKLNNVSMEIIAPGWNIAYRNVNTTNVTVAGFLLEWASRYNFSVKVSYWQEYHSLFVEAINGLENGENGSYWQYYVNDKYANLGCSNYILKDNDTVEWRFESSHRMK